MHICQRDDFNKLDATLQSFIQSYSQRNAHTAALIADQSTSTRGLITDQSRATREHITKETASLARDTTVERLGADTRAGHENLAKELKEMNDNRVSLDQEAVKKSTHQRLLRSLKYPTMNERRNQIADPSHKTFEWIFKSSVEFEDGGSTDNTENNGDSIFFTKYDKRNTTVVCEPLLRNSVSGSRILMLVSSGSVGSLGQGKAPS